MTGTDPWDVAVVGAGVVGAATAWALARRGARVVVLEQFEPGHPWGASHGRARIFRTAYADALYVELARAALPLWRELERQGGVEVLTLTGGVDHGEATAVAGIAAALRAAGEPHEHVTPEDAAARWPGLALDGPVLHHERAGRIDADAAVRAFLDIAVAAGAQLRPTTAVTAVEARAEDDVRLVTATGTVHARHAVLAAGGWTADLAAHVPGLRLPPLRLTQEQPALFAPALSPAGAGPWPTFVHHTADPADGVYGLAGPEGVKVGRHGVGPVVRAQDRARDAARVDAAELARLVGYARHRLPGVDAARAVAQTCTYTSTPDAHFVVDGAGPVTVAAGFSGHGFKFAPALGELVAHRVPGASGGGAIPALAPDLLERALHRFRGDR